MAPSSAASHISTAPSMTRFEASSTVSPSGEVSPDASHVLFMCLPRGFGFRFDRSKTREVSPKTTNIYLNDEVKPNILTERSKHKTWGICFLFVLDSLGFCLFLECVRGVLIMLVPAHCTNQSISRLSNPVSRHVYHRHISVVVSLLSLSRFLACDYSPRQAHASRDVRWIEARHDTLAQVAGTPPPPHCAMWAYTKPL